MFFYPFWAMDVITQLVPLLFVAVAAVIIVVIMRTTVQRARDRRAPVLTVAARVVAKRMQVGGYTGPHMTGPDGASHMNGHHTATRYFATFQVESGDRMEFAVTGGEYGLLADGDEGRLTFQGSLYRTFLRH